MNIYCIGRNYADHARELGNDIPESPVVFLKTTASLRGLEKAPVAFEGETFHFEGELVLKIAKDHKLGEKYSADSVEAVAFGLDLTRREEQGKLKKAGLPWTTSKSFVGSSLVGEFYPISRFSDLNNIEFEFSVNNEVRQLGNTKNMLFSISEIVTYLNSFSPLQKGDYIFTGTPEGVGEIRENDSFGFHFPKLAIKASGVL